MMPTERSGHRLVTLVSAIVAASTRAWASGEFPPPEREIVPPMVIVETQVGLTPLGQFGIATDWAWRPWMSLSAGLGLNASGDSGVFGVAPRFGVFVHPRWSFTADRRSALAVDVGMVFNEDKDNSSPVHRAHGGLAVEHQTVGGFRMRLFGGAGVAVGSLAGDSMPKRVAPILGLGLGYAFSPNPVVAPADSWSIKSWYGWQSLGFDLANAAMLVALQTSRESTSYGTRATSVRTAAFLFGTTAPLTHLAHRKYKRALQSLLLRVGTVGLFGIVASDVAEGTSGEGQPDTGLAILAVGMGIAVLVDNLLLAYE